MRYLTGLLLILLHGAATAQDKPERGVRAEDVYKNIQMFKGKPAARVIPAMDALTGLLGVKCDYCHVDKQWEKDDSPQDVRDDGLPERRTLRWPEPHLVLDLPSRPREAACFAARRPAD